MFFTPLLTAAERQKLIEANMRARMSEMAQECVDSLLDEERQKAADAKILQFPVKNA